MGAILAAALDADFRTLSREEIGAAGAAMMAAVKIRVYADMRECAGAWVTPSLDEITVPAPGLERLHSKLYPVYRTIRGAMPPAWARLWQVRQEHVA